MWFLLRSALAAPCLDMVTIAAHQVEYDLVGSLTTERWSLRFKPEECAEGLELPPDLAAAELQGTPEPTDDVGWSTQNVVRVSPLDESSGTLVTWGVPASQTEVRFLFGRTVPLQVYTDDRAHQRRKKNALIVWWDAGDDRVPELIWTTWNDWATAGRALAKPVERWIQPTVELGSLGRSLEGAELASLISRIDAKIDLPLEPVPAAGWKKGRGASEVLGTGRGTPSERGLILLSMLRGAGFKARPAWFSTLDDPDIPRTLPAPHLLGFPAIAVQSGKQTIYLDPGVRGARPPGVPARMRGGRVLPAGRHVVVPSDTGAPQGEVRVDAELQVDAEGRVVFQGTVLPTGSAEQALRAAFTGLEAQQWPDVVMQWITPRGKIRDLVVGVNGLDGTGAFSVDVRFTEPKRLVLAGGALQGPILDALAPGLAKLLPPGVAIAERLVLSPPEGMFALTAMRAAAEPTPQVLVNRSISTDEASLTLSQDWHVLVAGDIEDAVDDQVVASRVLLFPTAIGPAKRSIKKLDLDDALSRVVLALVLYRLDADKPAAKQLKKLRKVLSVQEISARLSSVATVGDRRPWETLASLVDSDAERIAVIDGLETIGDRRMGWQLATALTQSDDALTKTRAFVEVARLQGPRPPDAVADPEGQRAWREPVKLLEFAYKQAGQHRELTRLPLILAYLRRARAMDAAELLDDRDDSPAAQAAEAEFGAVTGVFGVDVLGLVDRALRAAPWDPAVREAAGRAQAALGLRRQGVRNVLLAAELSGNDHTAWLTAADYAAEMGDLGAALYAARRASDLVPRYVEPALQLQYYARLTADDASLQVGIDRLKQEMHVNLVGDLENLIEQEPSVELALLRHHTDVVEASKKLLRRRAQLHYERAMFEDAALDGSLLLDEHRDSTGARYLLAGVSSRFWHADPLRVLGRNGRTSTAREATMDLQIVTGDRVRAYGKRAATWNLARRLPSKIADAAPTWPVGMKDFEAPTPDGFSPNKILSGVRGVLAWSSPELQRTILRTERATGDLPPPLANLYSNGPTVLSTPRGVSVVRLDGGAIPIYAGITLADGQDVIGLGLTPATARDAVLQAIGELVLP